MRKISEIMQLLFKYGFNKYNPKYSTRGRTYYGSDGEDDICASIEGVFICIEPYNEFGEWSSERANEYIKLIDMLSRHKSLHYDIICSTSHSIMIYINEDWKKYLVDKEIVDNKLDNYWNKIHQERINSQIQN